MLRQPGSTVPNVCGLSLGAAAGFVPLSAAEFVKGYECPLRPPRYTSSTFIRPSII
jgi:hypothetical protein